MGAYVEDVDLPLERAPMWCFHPTVLFLASLVAGCRASLPAVVEVEYRREQKFTFSILRQMPHMLLEMGAEATLHTPYSDCCGKSPPMFVYLH